MDTKRYSVCIQCILNTETQSVETQKLNQSHCTSDIYCILLNVKLCFKSKSYIFVVDTFEQHQLPVGTLSMSLVLEGPTQLFHRHRYAEDCI